MKIIFSGGGTLGPVTPLIAIKDVISEKYNDTSFLWIGSKKGPEKDFVANHDIPFISLSSGKFRRYISFWNVIDIFRIIIGFFQSLYVLWQEKPSICVTAGGFISVPVHWAAWILNIPTWVHQQDVRVGLANRLIAPFATKITTALPLDVSEFAKAKTSWLGNPVRKDMLHGSAQEARKLFSLSNDLPVVFVTGGGTGSLRVNQMIVEAVQALEGKAQIIHLTGKYRSEELAENAAKHVAHYHVFQFFSEEMKHAYAVADIVVSRGGFGTISELAALKKAAIFIPKQGQQEENIRFLKKNNAAIFVNEESSNRDELSRQILDLLHSKDDRQRLGSALNKLLPQAENEAILSVVDQLVKL